MNDITEFLQTLHQEYTRFQARFGSHLLGVVEIGSFARGEAVRFSDHDVRLIIHCNDPLLVLDEHQWTEGMDAVVTTIDWQDLNQYSNLTFGLTNLAYIEQMLEAGRYPLIDHACLYQGRILVDDTGAVAAFRDKHRGTRFSNIVPDYPRQTQWRVTSRLPRELGMLTKNLNHRKYAVPSIHICYRILWDMAHIASYHEHCIYISDVNTLTQYYRDHWPWFQTTFDTVRAYKTDEALRQVVFNEVVLGLRADARIWVLPAGGLEPGETYEQAAVREVREETGYEIELERLVGDYWRPQMPHGANKMKVYVGRVVGGDPSEHDGENLEVRWFPLEALPGWLFKFSREHIEDALANSEAPLEKEQRLFGVEAALLACFLAFR